MDKIYIKLNEARKLVRSSGYKKDGRNDYSKYDYFTPEMVENIVSEVCEKQKLLTLCNLKADEFGLYQELTLIDLEQSDESHKYVCEISKYLRGESSLKKMPECTCDFKENDNNKLVFTLRTTMGEMKATNATQQMGGTDTYSERYIKMKVFQIKDNNLDFDSQDHTKTKIKVAKDIHDTDPLLDNEDEI